VNTRPYMQSLTRRTQALACTGLYLASAGLYRLRTPWRAAHYRTPYGGTWTDRLDAGDILEQKRAQGILTGEDHGLFRKWLTDGYVILRNAVPAGLCDAMRSEIDSAWRTGAPPLRMTLTGPVTPLNPAQRNMSYRIVDYHGTSRLARQAAFAPPVRRFLKQLFDRHVLAFQSLTFERGSGQSSHRDTMFVVVNSPLEMAASWIALEDIAPGSGELAYYPGSQPWPPSVFAGRFRHFKEGRDGAPALDASLAELPATAAARGIEEQRFAAKKGDVLIWSADLAHGGAPIQRRDATRWSHVTHYCPADVTPEYFFYLRPWQHPRLVSLGDGCFVSSEHGVAGCQGDEL